MWQKRGSLSRFSYHPARSKANRLHVRRWPHDANHCPLCAMPKRGIAVIKPCVTLNRPGSVTHSFSVTSIVCSPSFLAG
jgi:hypothetical protein